jgi:hypothetical protein
MFMSSIITISVFVKFDSSGNFLLKFGSNGSGDGEFSYPVGISVDSNGNVLVADSDKKNIQRFTPNGEYIESFGKQASREAFIGGIIGVAGLFDLVMPTVRNSTSNIDFSIDDKSSTESFILGGIVGYGIANVEKTNSTGDILLSGSENYFVGGITGLMYSGNITDSHASNNISIANGGAGVIVGGLAGQSFTEQ